MKFNITHIVMAFCLLFVTGITTSCHLDDSTDDPNNPSINITGTWVIKFSDGETSDALFQFENGGIKFLGEYSGLNQNVIQNTYTLSYSKLSVLHSSELDYPSCPDVKAKITIVIEAIYDNSISKFKGFLSQKLKGGSSENCSVQDSYVKKDVIIERKQ